MARGWTHLSRDDGATWHSHGKRRSRSAPTGGRIPESYDVAADSFVSGWEVMHHAMRIQQAQGIPATGAFLDQHRAGERIDLELVRDLATCCTELLTNSSAHAMHPPSTHSPRRGATSSRRVGQGSQYQSRGCRLTSARPGVGPGCRRACSPGAHSRRLRVSATSGLRERAGRLPLASKTGWVYHPDTDERAESVRGHVARPNS